MPNYWFIPIYAMGRLKMICQEHFLAREPYPIESRVEGYHCPVKYGQITELIRGLSLAPQYSLKQLRAIERRRTKNKLDYQQLRVDTIGGTKAF